MISNHIKNTGSIRFRRWSRAGYAVFASLGSTITIGRLVVSISDKSLQKSNSTSAFSNFTLKSDSDFNDNETELLEIDAFFNINQNEILSAITYDNAAATGHNSSYLLLTKAVEMGSPCFNRFFIYSK